MVRLDDAFPVYLHNKDLEKAAKKITCKEEDPYNIKMSRAQSCARFLIGVFFTSEELKTGTLAKNPRNKDKKQLCLITKKAIAGMNKLNNV